MKNFRYIILSFLIICLLTACEEKKNDKPFITVNPADLYISTYNNEKLTFTINVVSDYSLTDFFVTQKYEGELEAAIYDTSLNIKNFSTQWIYNTPADNSEDILLYFKAINSNGYQSVIGRRLIFDGTKYEETTGIRIYSANSNQPSALNLVTLEQVSSLSDTSVLDIRELQSDTSNTSLTKRLYSPSGCKFVKFNDYDYGNANSLSAKAAFESGIDLTEIANISVGDIYIVKITRLSSNSYCIVKITDIIDLTGKENDFYEFSVKN